MQQYIGIISKNETGRPLACNPEDYIKIRIPALHGPKPTMALTGSKSDVAIVEDDLLPWALVSRSFDNKNFSATEFQEDDLVYAVVQNNDLNSIIITGYASRFNYTDSLQVANSNLLYGGTAGAVTYSTYNKASSLVSVAKAEIGQKETPTNNIKYNSEFEDHDVNGTQYDWNVVFVWWCFKQIGASSDFYNGGKTRKISDLENFYKKAGHYVTKGQLSYYAGDLVFLKIDKSVLLAIVVADQTSDSIDVIIGDYNGEVVEKTIELDYIAGGIKLGDQVIANTFSGNAAEGKIFNLIRKLMGYNIAAGVAIIANLWHENRNFDPNLTVTDTDKKLHYGLCMWGPERFSKLKDFCNNNNYDPFSIDGQVYFIAEELGTTYTGVNDYLQKLPNTQDGSGDGAYYWAAKYEVCAEKYREPRRESAKYDFWPKYSASVTGNYINSKNGFILPLQYDNVVSPAWWHSYGKDEKSYHKGVDFITSGATGNTYGKQIVASKAGTVIDVVSDWNKGKGYDGKNSYGNYVLLDHGDNVRTRYAHCADVSVKKNDTVSQGQLIGTVGNTGNVHPLPNSSNPHQGAHVHFEIIINGARVNPEPYLPKFLKKDGTYSSGLNTATSSSYSKSLYSKSTATKSMSFKASSFKSLSSNALSNSNDCHIHVNRSTNIVTIYNKNNHIIKTMKCSVGMNNRTELGRFIIGAQNGKPARSRWRQLDGDMYGQYVSRFNNSVSFHSVSYYSQNAGDLESDEYKKLGTVASTGCVRLCVADAKWIYDNCKDGTEVYVYDDANEAIIEVNQTNIRLSDFKSASSNKQKWDPTDPDSSNPWNS